MQDNEKSGITFVNIPMEIFSSQELTANEKILYGYLSIFRKQCCFRSNGALAEDLGVSERTITNGLDHLKKLGYIFIEFVNGNSSARRIYVMFDNPKKTKYLIDRGYLKSFPQGSKICEGDRKNCVEGSKICEPHNRDEGSKICDHRIIKDNKNIGASALAMEKPSLAPKSIEERKSMTRNELIALEYAV